MQNTEKLKSELCYQLINEMPVLRARIGFTQEMLATKVGCSRQTINSLENRKKEMTWQQFMAIVAVFKFEESTRKMICEIPEFDKKLTMVLNEEIER